MTRRRLLVGALAAPALLAAAGGAVAEVLRAGGIAVSTPWARATPPGAKVGVGYLTLTSEGGDDRLLRVESPIADRVELHETTIEGGVARMRFLSDGARIPAGGSVVLGPGGMHLMLVGLKRPLEAPGRFAAKLVFEKAGEIEVTFEILPLGAMPHAH
jgi:copper(I)-binding protein